MKKTKLLYVGLGLSSIVALGTVATTISCSSSSSGRTVSTRAFNVLQSKMTRAGENVNIYQAEFNNNAKNDLTEIQKKLSISDLKTDFALVLTDFYECYEHENNVAEIEIESIVPTSKNEDGSFNLEVKYELEKAKVAKDSDVIKTTTIKWTPKMTFLTPEGIKGIIQKIKQYSNGDSSNGFDMSDLKELFLGDRDNDDNDFDDKGIFDKMRAIINEYESMAFMVAYEISVNDIFKPLLDQINPSAKVNLPTADTKFIIPSIAINGGSLAFVPNQKPKFDYATKMLTSQEMEAIAAKYVTQPVTEQAQIKLLLTDVLVTVPTDTTTIQSVSFSKNTTSGNFELLISLNGQENSDLVVLTPGQPR